MRWSAAHTLLRVVQALNGALRRLLGVAVAPRALCRLAGGCSAVVPYRLFWKLARGAGVPAVGELPRFHGGRLVARAQHLWQPLCTLRHAARRAPHAQRSHTNAGAATAVSSVSCAHEKHLQRASQALTSVLLSRQ